MKPKWSNRGMPSQRVRPSPLRLFGAASPRSPAPAPPCPERPRPGRLLTGRSRAGPGRARTEEAKHKAEISKLLQARPARPAPATSTSPTLAHVPPTHIRARLAGHQRLGHGSASAHAAYAPAAPHRRTPLLSPGYRPGTPRPGGWRAGLRRRGVAGAGRPGDSRVRGPAPARPGRGAGARARVWVCGHACVRACVRACVGRVGLLVGGRVSKGARCAGKRGMGRGGLRPWRGPDGVPGTCRGRSGDVLGTPGIIYGQVARDGKGSERVK